MHCLFVFLNTLPGSGKSTISKSFIKILEDTFSIKIHYFSKDEDPNYFTKIFELVNNSKEKLYILIDRNWPKSSLSKLVDHQKKLNTNIIGLQLSGSVEEIKYVSFMNIIHRENHESLDKTTCNIKMSKVLNDWYSWYKIPKEFTDQIPIINIKHFTWPNHDENLKVYNSKGPTVKIIEKYKNLNPLPKEIYCCDILTSIEDIKIMLHSTPKFIINPYRQYLSAVLTKESLDKIKELVEKHSVNDLDSVKNDLHCTLAFDPGDIYDSPYITRINQHMKFMTGNMIVVENNQNIIKTIITYFDDKPYHITLSTNGMYKPVDSKFAMLQALEHPDYKNKYDNLKIIELQPIEITTTITAVNKY